MIKYENIIDKLYQEFFLSPVQCCRFFFGNNAFFQNGAFFSKMEVNFRKFQKQNKSIKMLPENFGAL